MLLRVRVKTPTNMFDCVVVPLELARGRAAIRDNEDGRDSRAAAELKQDAVKGWVRPPTPVHFADARRKRFEADFRPLRDVLLLLIRLSSYPHPDTCCHPPPKSPVATDFPAPLAQTARRHGLLSDRTRRGRPDSPTGGNRGSLPSFAQLQRVAPGRSVFTKPFSTIKTPSRPSLFPPHWPLDYVFFCIPYHSRICLTRD